MVGCGWRRIWIQKIQSRRKWVFVNCPDGAMRAWWLMHNITPFLWFDANAEPPSLESFGVPGEAVAISLFQIAQRNIRFLRFWILGFQIRSY